MTPSELLEKLTALIPAPKAHLVRWSGCFAPNSPYRQEITLRPQIKKGFQFREDDDEDKPFRNRSWSKMLAKVFKIDVMQCENCGEVMRAVCAVLDRDSVVRYLKHLQIDYDPPPRAPPRCQQEELCSDQSVETEPYLERD